MTSALSDVRLEEDIRDVLQFPAAPRSPLQPTPLDQYVGYLRSWKRNAEGTITRYVGILEKLEQTSGKPFLSDRSIRLTHQDVVAAVTTHPQYAPETLAMFVKAARSWEKAGGFLGWWTPNGILDLSYPAPVSAPDPPLTEVQVGKIWRSCKTSREWRLVAVGLFAGPSVGDIERMDAPCWGEDRLRYTRRKTGRQVQVPLHPQLAALKSVILNGSNIAPGSLKVLAGRLAKRTGFHWTSNTLRRTFAQRLLDAEVPVWVVKSLMGHAPRDVLFTNYAVIPFKHLQAAIDTLHYPAIEGCLN